MAVYYADTHLHELFEAIRQAGLSPDDHIRLAWEAILEGMRRFTPQRSSTPLSTA